MLALRRLDAAGRRQIVDELRPRIVVVQVRAIPRLPSGEACLRLGAASPHIAATAY
jgi:hypothetical protein